MFASSHLPNNPLSATKMKTFISAILPLFVIIVYALARKKRSRSFEHIKRRSGVKNQVGDAISRGYKTVSKFYKSQEL